MLKPDVRVKVKPHWPLGWRWEVKYPYRFGGGKKLGIAVSKPEAIARLNAFLAKKDLGTYTEETG